MGLVLDTNTVISGLLWDGLPARIMHHAQAGQVELVTSSALLKEMGTVLPRSKFAKVFAKQGLNRDFVFETYAELCEVFDPDPIPPTVLRDPDDDAVLAAAAAGSVDLIVTGDRHLLDIGEFRTIRIVNAAQALAIIEGQESA